MLFQHMPEMKDCRLIWNSAILCNTGKFPYRYQFVQEVFHLGIAHIVKDLVHVNPQHHLQGI